jgi:hypothetical protein
MRKRIINPAQQESLHPDQKWLNMDELAEVEISSEDAAHPVESALLLSGAGTGWRAAAPGKQTIRLVFTLPQRIQRIWLKFVETQAARTQEFVLRWSADGGQSYQEIVRQQWNFSSGDSSTEMEDYHVDLPGVVVLELMVIPEIGGGEAIASLTQMRIA